MLEYSFQSTDLNRTFMMRDWQLPMQQIFAPHDTDIVQGKYRGSYWLVPASSEELPERGWIQCRTSFGSLVPNFIQATYFRSRCYGWVLSPCSIFLKVHQGKRFLRIAVWISKLMLCFLACTFKSCKLLLLWIDECI